MGNHTTQQDTDRRGGLVGRGAFTALAALTLLGGGAGVALADEAPADAGQDATQSQTPQQNSKASDDQKSADEQGSDQQGSDQKGSDQKGSDQAGSGVPTPSSLPGADSFASLTSLPTSAAALPSAPIVSSILGG